MLSPVTRSIPHFFHLICSLLFLSVLFGHVEAADIPAGKTVKLTASVSGLGPFVYIWYKNGSPLRESISATLAISNFQSANAGTYYVKISNFFGETQSPDVALKLASASAPSSPTSVPIFTVQPSSKTVSAGGTVSFSATATGATAYQWRKNGTAISGATSSTYTKSKVSSSDTGTYTVVASNSGGAVTSAGATLKLGGSLPTITSHPYGKTVPAGESVTLSVVASGASSYQWRKDGAVITGATDSKYIVMNVSGAKAGAYTVEVRNSSGSVTSNPAYVKIASTSSLPSITSHPYGKTVPAGESVTLSVVASGASSYQWRKDGDVITGATDSKYIVMNVSGAKAGAYTVEVRNSSGSVTSNPAYVKIASTSSLPSITSHPYGKTVPAGESVTLSVVASGASGYQWRKDGAVITGATGDKYIIMNASSATAGAYTVVVRNSSGSVTSNTAHLKIATNSSLPVITTHPYGKTVPAGDSVTLSVVASGASSYQWRKNGTVITGATDSKHIVMNASATTAGAYTVEVRNSSGSVMSNTAHVKLESTAAMAKTSAEAPTSSDAPLSVSSPAPKPVVADFDGDGKSDILLENILTGEHRLWLMSGVTRHAAVALSTLSTDWTVVGLGDFNGDGRNDILLQNLVTREVRVWHMAGATLSSAVTIITPPASMFVVGVGDFNGDQKADIVWRNSSTGEHSIRLMNGSSEGASVSLGGDPIWTFAGTGDFDGDGNTDLLWHKESDGSAGLWLMKGTVNSKWVNMGVVSPGWQIAGTGDFNGDQRPDILWEQEKTGARKVTFIATMKKTGEASVGTIQPEWIISN